MNGIYSMSNGALEKLSSSRLFDAFFHLHYVLMNGAAATVQIIVIIN